MLANIKSRFPNRVLCWQIVFYVGKHELVKTVCNILVYTLSYLQYWSHALGYGKAPESYVLRCARMNTVTSYCLPTLNNDSPIVFYVGKSCFMLASMNSWKLMTHGSIIFGLTHTNCCVYREVNLLMMSSKPARNIYMLIWCDFDRASSLKCGNKMPTRCNRGFYCRSYCLLNMFRAPLCPSSGA